MKADTINFLSYLGKLFVYTNSAAVVARADKNSQIFSVFGELHLSHLIVCG